MDLVSLEIIFVDDASDDHNATWNILLEIENEAPDSVCIIHHDQNKRQGGARNTALSYISGEYFLFLDSDDTIDKNACKTIYQIAEETDADMVLFNCMYRDEKGNSIPRSVYKERMSLSLTDDELRRRILLGHGLTYGCVDKLYRTEFYKAVGTVFPENMVYEEPLFIYPLFLYAKHVEIIPDYLYNYYIHPNSTVNGSAPLRRGDHPAVQFLLLNWLKKDMSTFLKYREEIMFYIIWSSFVETLNFTKNDPKSETAYQFYEYIRSIVVSEFPDYSENRYIRNFDHPEIFELLSKPIESKEILEKINTLIKSIFP